MKQCHFNAGVFFLDLTVRGREKEGEWMEEKEGNEEVIIEEEEDRRGRWQKKEEIKKDVVSAM